MQVDSNWKNNRNSSIVRKIRIWIKNPAGLLERMFEIIYFKGTLSARLRPHGDLLEISHLFSNSNSYQSGNHLQLHNVVASLSSPLVLLETGHIYAPNMPPNAFLSGNNWGQVRQLVKSKGSAEPGKYYPLPISDYYYHFLFDYLPRLVAITKQHQDVKVLTMMSQPQYVFEYLDLLNISYIKTKKDVVHLQTYVDLVESEITIEEIASKILEVVPPNLVPGPSCLYIGRRGISRESNSLDRGFLETLAPLGFENLDFSKMDVTSQIKAISNAKIIVGIHGGALSNIIFSKSCELIIEIFNHPYRTYFFKYAAESLGIEYISLEKEEALPKIKEILSTMENRGRLGAKNK